MNEWVGEGGSEQVNSAPTQCILQRERSERKEQFHPARVSYSERATAAEKSQQPPVRRGWVCVKKKVTTPGYSDVLSGNRIVFKYEGNNGNTTNSSMNEDIFVRVRVCDFSVCAARPGNIGGQLRVPPGGVLQQGEVLRPRVQPGVHPDLPVLPAEGLREGSHRLLVRAQQEGALCACGCVSCVLCVCLKANGDVGCALRRLLV